MPATISSAAATETTADRFRGQRHRLWRNGDDDLYGGDGSDRLEEGDGQDLVFGGFGDLDGDDTMSGQLGADVFRFDPSSGGFGSDVVTDFDVAGGDVIELWSSGFTTFDEVYAPMRPSESGTGTVILLGAGSSIVLANVDTAPATLLNSPPRA
jgi:Ca2+-binding RTX toxin-like protein